MNDLLFLLAQNALLLVAGTTLLLSLGCGAVLLCKSPVHRQRISELTIAGVLAWTVLALYPLPRMLPLAVSRESRAIVTVKPEVPVAIEAAGPKEVLTVAPLLVPETTEWVQVGTSVDGSDATEGPVSPPHLASPSEELSRQSAASTTPTPPAWSFDRTQLAGLFTGAYLAGAALCLLWIITGHVLLLRIRQTGEAPPEWLAKQYQALARQSGIAPPQLIVSRWCTRPLTWGVLWPVVVLPRSLCRQQNKSQLETILLHELGHVVQQDAQGNLLFCAALPLLYAHPLYWWLRRESQLAAELVADDWAAWQTGKETYVEELVALAKCTGPSSLPLVGVTGLFSSPSQFYRRMQMLLAREKPLSTKTSLPWRVASLSALAGAVVLAASLAGVRPAAGQTEPPAKTPVTTPPPTVPALTPPTNLPDPFLPPALSTPLGTEIPQPENPVAAPPAVETPATVPAVGPIPLALPPTADYPRDSAETALLAEIKQLQDKLRALEGKRTSKKTPEGKTDLPAQPGTNQIQITRPDEKGGAWSEIWTTDGEGRATKMISKTSIPMHRTRTTSDGKVIIEEISETDGNRSVQVIDGSTRRIISNSANPTKPVLPSVPPRFAAVTSDGKIIYEVIVEKDGSRRVQARDFATGKVVSENFTPTQAPRQTPIAPGQDENVILPHPNTLAATAVRRGTPQNYPIPIASGARVAVPSAPLYLAAQPTAEPNLVMGVQQLDLVSLATSYADAVGVLEKAQAEVDEHGKLSDQNVISQREIRAAKLALSAAQRKEQLLRSIAEVATESAAQEFERTSQLHKSGQITASAAGEAKTRMEILKQILHMQPAESAPKK